MATFVTIPQRFSITLIALVLFATSSSQAQFTGVWLDASSNVFTSGTNGDICMAINNAYLSPGFTGTIDARGFTGQQACISQPFTGANKPIELLLNRNVQIITSVGWWTPQSAHTIDGGMPGNVSGVGAILAACGPGIPGYSGTAPAGTCTNVGPSKLPVPNIAANLTFNVPHGPWPASSTSGVGNYICLICDGGQGNPGSGTGNGIGWNSDAFGSQIHGLRLDLGGNTNIIGLYTLNEQENSNWRTFSCGDYAASGATATRVACFAVDRTEAATHPPGGGGGGQSGPGNFAIDDVNVGGALMSVDATQSYGGMLLGEDITLVWTGCTVNPVAFVSGVNPAPPTGGSLVSISIQDGGLCTTPGVTAQFPSPTGSLTGVVWSNPSVTTGNASLTPHLAIGTPPQPVTSVTVGGANNNYPVGFVGGMKSATHLTLNGASSSPPARLNGGLIIYGNSDAEVGNVHTEKMVAGTLQGNGTGDGVQAGTYGFQANGFFHNLTSNSDVLGADLRFGVGIDNTQMVSTLLTSGTTLVQDDKNSVTISTTTCNTANPEGLSLYIPAGILTCPSNLQAVNSLTLNGSPSSLATIGASTVGNKLLLNGTTASVDSSGNLAAVSVTAASLTSTGVILAADGTHSAPSHSFNADTTTGMYRSTGSVNLSAGGQQAFFCTSSLCDSLPLVVFHDSTLAAGTEILPSAINNLTLNLLNSTGTATIASAAPAVISFSTAISATSLCSTVLCPVGTYRVDLYEEVSSPCGGATNIVWLGYTDDIGAKSGSATTTFIPISGTGATFSNGSLSLASTNNYGQGSFTVHTTGASTGGLGSINYGTTPTACTAGGSGSGKIYLTVTRMN